MNVRRSRRELTGTTRSFDDMTHYLVTGGTGFIGQRLVAALSGRDHRVSCLVRPGSDTAALHAANVDLIEGDVTDPQSLTAAVDGVDLVYHLAGRTLALSPGQFHAVNRAGCENVARVSANSSSRPPLVVVSSLAAGGPSRIGRPRTEIDADRPVSHYGRSKLAGEQAALSYSAQIPITVIRPPVVFGAGDRAGLTLFRAIRRTGWHIVPGRRDLPLSLIHVDDLVAALMVVGVRPSQSSRYYVAAPTHSTYGELGQMVAEAMERPVRLLRVRKGWLGLPAVGGELMGQIRRRPFVTNLDKFREARQEAWECSSQKFSDQFDFRPQQSLPERFQQTVDGYRAAGWL